jgi:ABC-type glycerol-3-phosphate transport system substrate-binding protein
MRCRTWMSLVLTATFALSGCTFSESPPDHSEANPSGQVTITFGASENERLTYSPLIASFNQANPAIRVQFVALEPDIGSSDPGVDALKEAVSAVDTTVRWSVQPEDIQRGYYYDLKPLMDADLTFDPSDFYPGALEAVSTAGTIAALPRTLSLPLLSYNKDLWAKHGLPAPAANWTWQDLTTSAIQLASVGGNTADAYGLLEWSGGLSGLYGELALAGVDLASTPPEQLQLDRPEIVAALNRVVGLVKARAIFISRTGNFSTDDFKKPILDQKVGMWLYGSLYLNPSDPKPAFSIGTTALPSVPPDLFGSTEGFIMSAGTQHAQEAWRWLSFLSRQPIVRPFDSDGSAIRLPARKSLAKQSGYWQRLDAETTAAVQAVLDRPVRAWDRRVAAALRQALITVVKGKQSAEQALALAQAQIHQQLAQAQASRIEVVVATPIPEATDKTLTRITYALMGSSDQVTRLARSFNQEHPDSQVVLKPIDFSSRPQNLTDLAQGADCFSWWGAPHANEVTATLDLQPLIDADASFNRDDYPAEFLAPYRRGTGLYGLPYAVLLRFLAYNQDAFDAAGIAHPTADWTLGDFQRATQALTYGEGAAKHYGFTGPMPADLFFFLDRLGASPTLGSDETLQPNFTDAKVSQAVRTYLSVLRDFSPHQVFQGYRQGQPDDNGFSFFAQGHSGMFFGYGTAMDRPQGFTTAIAPPPLGSDPITANDAMPAGGLYISATTAHPEACWTWLKYLSSDLSILVDGFPVRISLAESDEFSKRAPVGAREVYAAYRAAFAHGVPAPSRNEVFYDSAIDYYWFFLAVDQALHGKALDPALDEAQTRTTQYLACVRSGIVGPICAKQVDPNYEGLKNAPPR